MEKSFFTIKLPGNVINITPTRDENLEEGTSVHSTEFSSNIFKHVIAVRQISYFWTFAK